jgi:hypothetical protein
LAVRVYGLLKRAGGLWPKGSDDPNNAFQRLVEGAQELKEILAMLQVLTYPLKAYQLEFIRLTNLNMSA